MHLRPVVAALVTSTARIVPPRRDTRCTTAAARGRPALRALAREVRLAFQSPAPPGPGALMDGGASIGCPSGPNQRAGQKRTWPSA
jgi:hypothetical protein